MDRKTIFSSSEPALARLSSKPMLHCVLSLPLRMVSDAPPPSTVTDGIVTSPNVNMLADTPPVSSARSNPSSVNVVEPTVRVEPVSAKFASAVTATASSPAPTNVIDAVEPASESDAVSSRRMSASLVPVTRMPPDDALAAVANETTARLLSRRRYWLLTESNESVRSVSSAYDRSAASIARLSSDSIPPSPRVRKEKPRGLAEVETEFRTPRIVRRSFAAACNTGRSPRSAMALSHRIRE